MAHLAVPDLTVVVPLYNEAAGLEHFNASLIKVIKDYDSYELIYVNDGSTDDSLKKLRHIASEDKAVRVISLSRNFGKEVATTAGIQAAKGQVIVTLDADGQHPVELIPQFVDKWEAGAQVVIGIRSSRKTSFIKRTGSKLFQSMMKRVNGITIASGSTDFRLIDREVQQAFVAMPERNRMTRGLIDWLGFERQYVEYQEKTREHGEATYSFKKLSKLFIDSLISHSTSPLYIAAYIGGAIIPLAVVMLAFMGAEMLSGDPLNLNITGGAYVLVLVLMLIGVLLLSQGIIGLYLSHIHAETQGRPLYVINQAESIRSDG
jgi:glycosyltransferase involved in cell wall biosynthesis